MRCPTCRLERLPHVLRVSQGRKRWEILTCRICKYKDIREFIPAQLWNNDSRRFEAEKWAEGEIDATEDSEEI